MQSVCTVSQGHGEAAYGYGRARGDDVIPDRHHRRRDRTRTLLRLGADAGRALHSAGRDPRRSARRQGQYHSIHSCTLFLYILSVWYYLH